MGSQRGEKGDKERQQGKDSHKERSSSTVQCAVQGETRKGRRQCNVARGRILFFFLVFFFFWGGGGSTVCCTRQGAKVRVTSKRRSQTDAAKWQPRGMNAAKLLKSGTPKECSQATCRQAANPATYMQPSCQGALQAKELSGYYWD